jgi:hypothetical protein
MPMKTLIVRASTSVTIDLADALNQIEGGCVPENIYIKNGTLVHFDPETKQITENLGYPADHEKQIKDILAGLYAIRQYYGLQR